MTTASGGRQGLGAWSLFAALIAAAGLPIYIHAPKYYADTYGISLAALGGTLALLRLIDVVQDPLFGWLAEVMRARLAAMAAAATAMMAAAMLGLFAVTPPVAPLLWFALMLTGLFSGFSFLTIVFYGQGVEKASSLGEGGHLRLAGWREAGALIGVCLAATAPVMLAKIALHPFAAFAVGFAGFALIAGFAMRRNWQAPFGKAPFPEVPFPEAPSREAPSREAQQSPPHRTAPAGLRASFEVFRPALSDPIARRLLVLALINAAPVAVTSTLFLFFVESRLQLPGKEGVFLLIFFVAAAASTPIWSRLGSKWGAKPALALGMSLAIATFLWAALLSPGQATAFAVISAASGAALGADMVLLPAIFARRLAQLGQTGTAAAFGLWSFVSKLSLALAAVTLLPALDAAGFKPGPVNSSAALTQLALLYAGLPCALKALALTVLALSPFPEE